MHLTYGAFSTKGASLNFALVGCFAVFQIVTPLCPFWFLGKHGDGSQSCTIRDMLCVGNSRRFLTLRTHATTSADSLSRLTLSPELSLCVRTLHESLSAHFLKMPSVNGPFLLMDESISYRKEKYCGIKYP